MSRLRTVSFAAALALLATVGSVAHAQVTWTADRKASLAWWQINPHMNHLWATTCPQEPSWRPGEGRSAGWVITQAFRPTLHGDATGSDTSQIPLYPRRRVRSVCSEAVEAKVVAPDTVNWKGLTGEVTVDGNALVGGYDVRDEFTRQKLLQTNQFPVIKFVIDSLTRVQHVRDTLKAVAVGTFTLRGVDQPAQANLRIWDEPGGRRVMGRFKIPAKNLIPVYNMSGLALGMGVGTNIWIDLYLGVDLLMHKSEGGASN